MAFEKGKSGNPEGRPSGSKDKLNKEIREAFQNLVEGNLENIGIWLTATAEKDPAKALDFLLKLSEFIVPKLKAMDLKTDMADNVIIVRPPDFTAEERAARIAELRKKLDED